MNFASFSSERERRSLPKPRPTDFYWGVGRDGTGQNRLGHLLMRIRAELREL
jgi:predicted NAD-dependent protein-ADP-ribosyltransferase YbiA (DUF1768 family)